MELDPETAQAGPWREYKLASISQYLRSLEIPDDFEWRHAMHAVLMHLNMGALMPLADSLLQGAQKARDGAVGGLSMPHFVHSLLARAINPLQTAAVGAPHARSLLCLRSCGD